MGTPVTEPWREAQEVPHAVRLTVPYYLARYELTQSQWAGVMGANPSNFKDCGGSCPVERVNYLDVERFLHRLNQRGRPGFRLPTEAEWEYACRAGGTEPFGHRSSLSSLDANIDGTYPYNAPKGIARNRTTAVGQFAPNPWGFFDMSGNVWEWVQDWYCLYPDKPVADPVGRCSSEFRVIRGGSWKFDGGSARCGVRYTHRPQDSGYSLGVRLAHNPF
jgi:formylglycine-generating enzyme required for sulfatase activity